MQSRYHPVAYLHDEMMLALAAADFSVARAGASTLGEFPVARLPSVLAPLVGVNQTANADLLASRGGAVIIADEMLQAQLPETLQRLLQDPTRRFAMEDALRKLARPDAAFAIAREIVSLGAVRLSRKWGFDLMTQDTQVLLAILIYLAFFAWIGWRRGLRSELTVFVVALIVWVLLQERGTIFVRMTNLMPSSSWRLLGSSLASGTVDEGSLESTGDFVASGGEESFLFLLWIVVLFLTYFITSRPSFASKSKSSAWSAIVGALNGLLFLAVMLPKFSQLYIMGGGQFSDAPLRTFVALMTQFITYLIDGIRSFWEWVQPLSPVTLLIIITAVLGLTAYTLRGGAKAKT